MPIRRWRGWCAICRRCGKIIDLTGDGQVAYGERGDVLDSLDLPHPSGTIEQAITDACGCERKRK